VKKGVDRLKQNRVNEARFRVVCSSIKRKGYVKTGDFGRHRKDLKGIKEFFREMVRVNLFHSPVKFDTYDYRYYPTWR